MCQNHQLNLIKCLSYRLSYCLSYRLSYRFVEVKYFAVCRSPRSLFLGFANNHFLKLETTLNVNGPSWRGIKPECTFKGNQRPSNWAIQTLWIAPRYHPQRTPRWNTSTYLGILNSKYGTMYKYTLYVHPAVCRILHWLLTYF